MQQRERAYQIWEDEGRPEGRHDDHWTRAAKAEESADQEFEDVTKTDQEADQDFAGDNDTSGSVSDMKSRSSISPD
jgi:hypothetical protein